MLSNINNLEELLAEKARLRKQLEIVQGEMDESAKRTREELRLFLEDKFSLAKQIGQFFQGGTAQAVGGKAVGALGQAAGMSAWWSGILATLTPVLVNFVRRQLQRRQERKLKAAEMPAQEPSPKAKRRKLFKRKPKNPDGGGSEV